MKSGNSITKRLLFVLILLLPVATLPLWDRDSQVIAQTEDTYQNLETFTAILHMLQENYVEDVDSKELLEGAIKGMLNSLDPHSSYMDPEDFKDLQIETKGSFSGIGIEITMKDSILTVVSPIDDTPAFKKGLKAGDKILKIEGEPTKDMTLVDAVKRLRGPNGTDVTISIHREGWTELKDFTITRDNIPLISVKAKTLEPGYGYIRIRSFQANTTKDFKKSMDDLTKDGDLKGLVLDLRNNPGGLLDQAVRISDVFLDEGLIVYTKSRRKENNLSYSAHKNGTSYTFPIVVLVNEGSASASEIVAGALQDHKRALVLGAQSFGKGSVQTIHPMSNGAGLRLTTALYYTPNGRSIQATGITPDIIVPTSFLTEEELEEKNGKEKPQFIREKDLRHHFDNKSADSKNKKDPKKDKELKDVDDKIQQELDEIKTLIEKDNQLKQGLMILKSAQIFGAMRSK
ncbi:MAG: S41 family peptidase [Proteobacteria bacterium]|nr:S41 family peptidase [Pseudomonadota bacterium]MBU1639965.1 S41 family peptidase [Pseudomonadota bacterium]